MKQLILLLGLVPIMVQADWQRLTREDTLDAYWDPDTVIMQHDTRTVLILINNITKTKQDKEASIVVQAKIHCSNRMLRYQGSKSYTGFMGKGSEVSELSTTKYTNWFKVPAGNYFENFLISNLCK